MNSIDKLREWANGLHGVYINQVDHTITVTTCWDAPPDMDSVNLRDHVNGILDGIEQEVADMRGFCERLDDAATNREDVTLFGVDYMPYPLDADGEPIHVGDVMEWCQGGNVFTVTALHLVSREWEVWGDDADYAPDMCRHHHAPTVEDVLREFAERWHDAKRGERTFDYDELIAEFAAKLRLAGDE